MVAFIPGITATVAKLSMSKAATLNDGQFGYHAPQFISLYDYHTDIPRIDRSASYRHLTQVCAV